MANEKSGLSRRHFLLGSLLAGAVPSGGFGSVPSLKALGYQSPNQRLNIGAIGAGGRPFGVLRNCEPENIVALADVDWTRAQEGFDRWPKAAKYKDFREMLDKSGKDLDAIVIGTPDHTHAHCALACMELGKHVYVEKPLTRTSWEARLLTQAAQKHKVATQMGNQGYSHDATRVACEILWSGEIGDVSEVHAWQSTAVWPQGMTRTPPPSPIPDTLNWDVWLGGADWREYTAGDQEYLDFVAERRARSGRGGGRGGRPQFGFYLPFNWRGFYDFGSGLIGDWGIHILGPANWGLQLSPAHLISVECVEKDSHPPFTFPDSLTIKYDFGAREGMPPVAVYWHNVQGEAYTPEGMTVEEARKIEGRGPQVGPPRTPRGGPGGAGRRRPQRGSGYNSIMVGSKGYLGTSGRGEGVGLLPGSRWAEYELPAPYLSRSPGASTGSNSSAHVRDWIRACKGGAPSCSNFGIGGPFTEWLVLGAAAVHAEGKLLWNNDKGEFSNNSEVNRWVKPKFRKGWELKL